MKNSTILAFLALVLTVACSNPQTNQEASSERSEKEVSDPVYELRTYYAADGKLDNLLTRFRDHTLNLFEKHGMTNVAYWVPTNNVANTLVYILRHESRAARDASFDAFRKDPDWLAAKEASEVDGGLVDSIKNIFLKPTDYSPALAMGDDSPRVFEMRTYYCNEGKLPDLHDRFRNHTMGIFERLNMKNIVYFTFDSDQEGVENTLLYFLSHSTEEDAQTNWQTFIADEEWKAAYTASIENGRLVERLTSQILEPVDFSPMK